MLHLHFPMTGDQLTAAFRQRHWAKVGPPFRRLGILVLLLATLLAGSAFGPLHNAVSGELKAFLLVSTLIFALVLGVSFLVAALGLRLVTKALGPASAALGTAEIPVSLQVDADGVGIDYIDNGRIRPWSDVTGFEETRDFVLILFGRHEFAFVPKRSVSPTEMSALRAEIATRRAATAP